MCTAIATDKYGRLIGRNLDYEVKYGESLVVLPRGLTLKYKLLPVMREHAAMIGIAKMIDGYPLYFDAINEHGVGCIALSFPESARYHEPKAGCVNLAAHEVIQYVLSGADSIDRALELLKGVNIVPHAFRDDIPPAPLHWLVSDGRRSLVLESEPEGVQIYENETGVLTNEPPFPFHKTNLRIYLNSTREVAENRFSDRLRLTPFSRGAGGVGIPGDHSSPSRFVRAAFTLNNSELKTGASPVTEAFHVLGSVEQQSGAVMTEGGLEYTQYTSVADLETLTYYIKTYSNHRIRALRLEGELLTRREAAVYQIDGGDDVEFLS